MMKVEYVDVHILGSSYRPEGNKVSMLHTFHGSVALTCTASRLTPHVVGDVTSTGCPAWVAVRLRSPRDRHRQLETGFANVKA